MSRRSRTLASVALVAALAAVGGCASLSGGQRLQRPPAELEIPKDAIASAAQAYVEKAMAEATSDTVAITISQVAAFLHLYGLQVCGEQWNDWQWTQAEPGSAPVIYYVARAQWAVAAGDAPHARLLLTDRATAPYCIKVRAFDSAGRGGPWSLVGWSDGGDGTTSLDGIADD